MKPCANCPFLREQVRMLRPARKREIAAELRRGGWFPCHKTVDYEDSDEGRTTHKSRWCAGALATMENNPRGAGAAENQAVRIAQRLGILDLDKLTGRDLVFGSLREWCAGGCVPAGRRTSATDTTLMETLGALQGAPCPNCGQRHDVRGCVDA